MLERALFGFCYLVLATIGNVVWEMQGLPIGAIMSSPAVSLFLGAFELAWYMAREKHMAHGFDFGAHDPLQYIRLLRYVDDVMALSFRVCPACVLEWMCLAYPLAMSPCSGVGTHIGKPRIWADVEVRIQEWHVDLIPKNDNREWLHHGGVRLRQTFIPYPGQLPCRFGILRSTFCSKLRRARSLRLDQVQHSTYILELALELYYLSYPRSVVRAIIHSLPLGPATLAARRVFRAWAPLLPLLSAASAAAAT